MLQFKRIDLLTNQTFISHFNVSHHWSFCDNYSVNTQKTEAPKLIKKWNLQQPLKWKYELVNCKSL